MQPLTCFLFSPCCHSCLILWGHSLILGGSLCQLISDLYWEQDYIVLLMRPWHCQFVRTGGQVNFWTVTFLHFYLLGRICHGFSRILAAAHFLPSCWLERIFACTPLRRHESWWPGLLSAENCYQELVCTLPQLVCKEIQFSPSSAQAKWEPSTFLLKEPVSQKLVFTSGNMFERLLMDPQSRRWITVLEIPTHLPNHPEGAVGKTVDKLTWKRV